MFVFMTSTSGLIGNLGQASYSAAKLALAGLSKSIALGMEKFGVRSNCIGSFAWSRMIGALPAEAGRARVEPFKQMTPDKFAPRPVLSVHRAGGWTPQAVLSHALPAMQAHYHGLDRMADVFTWDPV